MRLRPRRKRFTRCPQASNAVPRGRGDFTQDSRVAGKAKAESRVLLTFDLDFGAVLALGASHRPSVLIFRLSDARADAVNRRLEVVLSEQASALQSGALVLVEDTRYRMRLLPIRSQ